MNCRHSIAVLGLLVSAVAAADVTVAGLFPNKAVVQIDGGTLQTLSVGQKATPGVTLVSVDRQSATFDVQGKRATLRMGQQHVSRSAPSGATVVLSADARGHFVTDGQINGVPVGVR